MHPLLDQNEVGRHRRVVVLESGGVPELGVVAVPYRVPFGCNNTSVSIFPCVAEILRNPYSTRIGCTPVELCIRLTGRKLGSCSGTSLSPTLRLAGLM